MVWKQRTVRYREASSAVKLLACRSRKNTYYFTWLAILMVLAFSVISLLSGTAYAETGYNMTIPYPVSTENIAFPLSMQSAHTPVFRAVYTYGPLTSHSVEPLNISCSNSGKNFMVNPQQDDESDSGAGIFSKIKDYFKDPDWLLIGLIIAAIVVVVLTIIVLLRPRGVSDKDEEFAETRQPISPQQPAGRQQQMGAQQPVGRQQTMAGQPPVSKQPMGGQQAVKGQQPLVCPSCGTQNPPGRKFCGTCGAGLSAVTQQGAPAATKMVPCPSCGTPNPPEKKFCGNCGMSLLAREQKPPAEAPREALCPACGTSNPPGRKFCGTCGTSLTAGTQQKAAQAPQEVFCTSCGTANPPGRSFCGSCGAGLIAGAFQQQYEVAQSFTCPICGATISTGVNPCPNCKTWLDWG
jgi:hypothetical protein